MGILFVFSSRNSQNILRLHPLQNHWQWEYNKKYSWNMAACVFSARPFQHSVSQLHPFVCSSFFLSVCPSIWSGPLGSGQVEKKAFLTAIVKETEKKCEKGKQITLQRHRVRCERLLEVSRAFHTSTLTAAHYVLKHISSLTYVCWLEF